MSQVSSILRRVAGGYAHWCPACKEMHILPDSWTFINKDLENPTFIPSFSHEGIQKTYDDNGKWIGWKYDADGNPLKFICHYILTDGKLNYCIDSTHSMKGQVVDIPKLPEGHTDERFKT